MSYLIETDRVVDWLNGQAGAVTLLRKLYVCVRVDKIEGSNDLILPNSMLNGIEIRRDG